MNAVRALVPDATTVEIAHCCPVCGSIEHGQPTALINGVPRSMSTSTSGPHRLTAIARRPGSAVGVDVESVAEIAARWTPDVVLAAGEQADTPEDQAWSWVAKEALLKAWGVGLTRPMTAVRLADHVDQVRRIDAPAGYVAALAGVPSRQGAAGSSV